MAQSITAKQELLSAIKANDITSKIKCALLQTSTYNEDGETNVMYVLPQGHSFELKDDWFDSLTFDSEVELDGTIWFEDGSWMTREEYDGEYWLYHKLPEVHTLLFPR